METTKLGILDILLEGFESCTDCREGLRVYYSLTEILFLTFCGVLSGCEGYQDICDFGELKLDWLRKYKPYKNGIPSHDTINRAMNLLSSKQLSKLLMDSNKLKTALKEDNVWHVDGKSLAKSATKKQQQTPKTKGGRQAIQTVNVFCSSLRACIASEKTQDKGGEKHVLKDILDVLDCRGKLLTMDANFCHHDVVSAVCKHEADYLIGLKKNQPTLLATAEKILTPENIDVDKCIGKEERGHGRIEKRNCYVLNINKLRKKLSEEDKAIFSDWYGLKSIIRVDATRTEIAKEKTSIETRYYISSREFTAEEANKLVRSHWSIENNLHWVLDTIFGEDDNQTRNENAAFALSIFRKIAANKLANYPDPKSSIKGRMRKCAMSEAYLDNVLKFS